MPRGSTTLKSPCDSPEIHFDIVRKFGNDEHMARPTGIQGTAAAQRPWDVPAIHARDVPRSDA
jgi:hypothetical protein